MKDAISKAADDNNKVQFVIIDDVIEGKDNVASVTFADNEAAYLAGIAAAMTTKTKTVGFVGGMEGTVVTRFEKALRQALSLLMTQSRSRWTTLDHLEMPLRVRQLQQRNTQQVLMLSIR